MSLVSKLFRLLNAEERHSAYLLFFMMLIGVFLETFSIGLIIPALAVMTGQNPGVSFPMFTKYLPPAVIAMEAKQLVIWGMLLLVVVYVVKSFFLVYLAWLQNRFTFKVQTRISKQLLTSYLAQPYIYHLQRNSAQLILNITTGVYLLSSAISHGLVLLTEILIAASISLLLFKVEPLGTAAALCLLGLSAFFISRAIGKRNVRWGEKSQHHEGMRIQYIQQCLGGVKEILLLGRAKNFISRYAEHNTKSGEMIFYQNTTLQIPRLVLEALSVCALAALVIMILLRDGSGVATVIPIIGLFATAAFRLMPSINRILSAIQNHQYQRSTVDTIYDELTNIQADTRVISAPVITNKVSLKSAVVMKNISYTYPNTQLPALSKISIKIIKGDIVGFIGTSGAGKSTLVDILLGLLQPTEGKVLQDGVDIKENIQAWQKQIGYVPQTIFLTDESLRQNIAFGIPDDEIDDSNVQRALLAAQLSSFVDGLPEGLMTLVGERGVRLSGGQRQRIGIARALYHDPDILVLDEATSALDNETEQDVMQAIYALHGQKTILMVAHRTSTVAQCDYLYRLEHGKIVAEGSPSELL